MSDITRQRRTSSGFALLVVLSTLTILTLLFAISSKRSLTHIRSQNTEVSLAKASFQNVELLRAVAARGNATNQVDRAFNVQLGDEAYTVSMVDVGGLVDLNSAAPNLLSAYFEVLGLSSDDLAAYRRWRQQSRRLLHVEDLPRILAKPVDTLFLTSTSTVHSGRSGLALDKTPERLTNELKPLLDLELAKTPSSNMSFLVIKETVVGVVHFPPGRPGKVIGLR